jgi:hypothetical protein
MRAQVQDDPDTVSIHEDADIDTPQDDSLPAEDLSRPALKDITDDNYSTTTDEVVDLKQSTTTKKAKSTKKKPKQAKKEADTLQAKSIEGLSTPTQASLNNSDMQFELHEQSKVSLEASETLAPAHPLARTVSETNNTTMSNTPEKPMAVTTKTPKFDPQLHVPTSAETSSQAGPDDSFVGSIKTRSPIKLSREPSCDSFLESIKSRSPATRTSRIEDSVEAMDALEDAIEEFSTKLPQVEHLEIEEIDSPVKVAHSTPKVPSSTRKPGTSSNAPAKTPQSTKKSPIKAVSSQTKPAPPRSNKTSVSPVKPISKAPHTTKSTFRPTIAPKSRVTEAPMSGISFSNSPLKQQPNLAKKRVTSGPLSTSKPAFVPAKSSKPPTKSTFSLPGEAIAAKLKAQREERAKQEEEEMKKKLFKARPAPSMSRRPSVAPRENKASLARKSSAQIVPGSGENKENISPKPRPAVATSEAAKTLDIKKVRPTMSPAVRANSSVRRANSSTPSTNPMKKTTAGVPSIAPKPVTKPSAAPRVASLTRPVRPSNAIEDLTQPKAAAKVNGKEIYSRSKLEREKLDEERREKEEAAKKARAEAAERGRQASRDWAEKQKRKMEAQKAAQAAVRAVPAVVEAA